MSIIGRSKKGIMSAVFLHRVCDNNISLPRSIWFVPSLTCVSTTVSLLCLSSLTDCSVSGAVRERLVVDVPVRRRQPLHGFPPVVDLEVLQNIL
ncbi:hypothetical protein F2P81_001501 [Scophthalmus maximus]|uniref:Uncharacterized protein n=1 Tax=Scophthalmus maximus TaxID=52904 RepID=A0A6A4TSE5_SCOMX|nr:hypothetical protein F2P81_001501 [Scophthalmus maximus]